MSSELDTATATRIRSTSTYQAGGASPVGERGFDAKSRPVFFPSFFFHFRLASPNISALSPDHPRIPKGLISRLWAAGLIMTDHIRAASRGVDARDRDRGAPRFSAPGRFCAPLTAIICKKKKLRDTQARRGTPRGGPVSTLVSATHHPRRG